MLRRSIQREIPAVEAACQNDVRKKLDPYTALAEPHEQVSILSDAE
jgi:hypothetical protein